jgi:hypothetical protein
MIPLLDLRLREGPQNVNEFGEVEEEILDLMDVQFFDEVGDHVEQCVQN